MADTAASSPQASLPDSPSRTPSPYVPSGQTAGQTILPPVSVPPRPISDRSMTDDSAGESRPMASSSGNYEQAPPSPSNTSQSDDAQDFEDMASSSFNIDKSVGPQHSRLLETSGGARLSRRGTLIPASTSSAPSDDAQSMALDIASASSLPHEILVHIFRYVSGFPPDLLACLQVCKAWCICGVELLWHRPSFYKISSLFKLIAVIRKSDQLFPYADFVRRLNFTILASQLEDKLFVRMSACSRLERLTLAGCCHIQDETLVTVFKNTKQLVALDLTDVANLTDDTLRTLADNCLRLQGINLTGCKKITSEGVIALAKSSPLLRRVKLCGCENVSDDALIALADNCPVLLEVDMINCHNITDKSVREIWRKSYNMRELRLAQCGDLTDDAFPSARGATGVAMLGTNQNLAMRAGIGSVAYESTPASRGSSPSRFQAGENGAEYGSGLSTGIPSPMSSQRMFDHLRVLDLTSCNSITDVTVEGIVANVPKLKNLVLAKCTRLTDESVYSISKLGKNLHYLHLGHVSNITDRAVTHLARSCTRLRYIDLACCPHLTDLSVFELAANLPKLRRIGLVKVVNLTDQAIYSLVDRHTSLERIHLSYCENISVPAIFFLLQRLNRLTHLSLTGVPAFRQPELQAMCRPPPKDFNEHQRQAFCVFSGKGVNDLRRHLQKVYSDENSAAQFGELAPDVRRALAMEEDENYRNIAIAALQRTRAASDVPPRTVGMDPHVARGGMTDMTQLSTADQLYYQQQMEIARMTERRGMAAAAPAAPAAPARRRFFDPRPDEGWPGLSLQPLPRPSGANGFMTNGERTALLGRIVRGPRSPNSEAWDNVRSHVDTADPTTRRGAGAGAAPPLPPPSPPRPPPAPGPPHDAAPTPPPPPATARGMEQDEPPFPYTRSLAGAPPAAGDQGMHDD